MSISTARGVLHRRSRPARRHATLWAVLSAMAIVVIVIVVPVALFVAGGLPFSHARGLLSLFHGGSSHPDDRRLVARWLSSGALTLAWVTWAWMTLCVARELRSWIVGRSSPALPASKTMQSIAACLVGTVLAMSATGRQSTAPRAPHRSSVAAVSGPPPLINVIDDLDLLTAEWAGGQGPALSFGPAPTPSGPTGAAQPVPGLAPAGGPMGRAAESDGGLSASRGKDEKVQLQAHLDLPARSGVPLKGAERQPSVPTVHRVGPRETLWSIASDQLGSSLRWKEILDLNLGVRQSDGGGLDSTHWITPGWDLRLPDGESPSFPDPDQREPRASRRSVTTAHATGTPTEVSEPVPGVMWRSDSMSPSASGVGGPKHVSRQPLPTPLGAGVVGAGVVNLLDRMRRAQQRHRNRGMFIRLPDRPQAAFEQRLRLGEGRQLLHEIDLSMRRLTETWADSGDRLPVVAGVKVYEASIEILLEGPGQSGGRQGGGRSVGGVIGLPDGFVAGDDGTSVVIERSSLRDGASAAAESDRRLAPAPLLVTLGQHPEGLSLVNLESMGSLAVTGEPDECDGVLRALSLELATSLWADKFDLELVGFGAELERFERVSSTTDVSALIRRLCHRRIQGDVALQASGFDSFSQARSFGRPGNWDPLVVICGQSTSEHDVGELLELASNPRLGMAIVAVGEPTDGSPRLTLSGPTMPSSLALLESTVVPQRIEPEELAAVTELLDSAATRESVLRSDEPYLTLPVPIPAAIVGEHVPGAPSGAGTSRASIRTHFDEPLGRVDESLHVEVEVAVLGPIAIRGAVREFTRAWAKELVVYLSMHPGGVSNEAWATALWPERLMAPSSLHSTASVARRALGQSPDGRDHLPRSHGRLALSDSVRTDWSRFVILADSGDIEMWSAALELVRGRPFDGLRSSDWPILEGIGPAIEASVIDLSGRLAGAYLGMGNPRGAEWSARKGLLVSPYDERLYRMLMRAADADGNPAGVESVMSELIRLVADDVEPFDSVHPSTMDLYRSLTRRRSPIGPMRAVPREPRGPVLQQQD
jgi:DNA-binding SARP family transcriptional activator